LSCLKNLDKPKLALKGAATSKKHPFLLVVLLLLIYTSQSKAQKLIINANDGKITGQDTAVLNRLIKYEAYIYNGLFDKQIPDSLPVIINLYKSRKQFLEVRNAHSAVITKSGFYSPSNRQCYIYQSGDYLNVTVHEVSHFLMHYHNYYGVPNWINEGMAEFFEGLYMNEKNAIYVDQQTGRLQKLKGYISSGELDMARFLGPEMSSWSNKQDIDLKYNAAYGMVYFIIKTHPEYIKQILTSLKKGESSTTALANCYGSFEFFVSRFKAFYR
jgi:hypothetical protein